MEQLDARLPTNALMVPTWFVLQIRAHARIHNSGMALIVVQFKVELNLF